MNRKDDLVNEQLKRYGITFQEPELIEKYYHTLKGMMLADLVMDPKGGVIIDLDALPVQPIPFKEIFIKWLVQVNLPRIKAGMDPMVTYELAMRCPLWRLVRPPFKRVQVTPQGLFNQPGAKTVGKKQQSGSINKKSKS